LNELVALGETIDPLTDAAVTPQTFRPECSLTFTLLRRLTDFRNSFGWYNVTGQVPAADELYEFIHCDDVPVPWEQGTNQTSRVLAIKDDPRYLGGEIGFFQARALSGGCANVGDPATVQFVVYSQPELNPEDTPEPFIHLIIMDSKIQSNVFYFAWEDLISGGDNDFSDLLLRIEGITCSGGGEACDTGESGVCGPGLTQCENGEIVCLPRQAASDEACNGLDDDCDGAVDDGDLCEPGEICDRGVCIRSCGGGEFRCSAGLVCRDDGYCVDPACETVQCDVGQICYAGDCVDPCGGVVCPFGQECRAGRCVDPCAGVACGDNRVCIDGACLTTCECSGCGDGSLCSADRGMCIEAACNDVSCEPGTHCEGGSCVDDCDGAVCPPGQSCEAGECVGEISEPGSQSSSSGGGTFDGGIPATGSASSVGSGSSSTGSNGAGGASSGRRNRAEASGCGCRFAPGPSGAALAFLGLAAASWFARRRRETGKNAARRGWPERLSPTHTRIATRRRERSPSARARAPLGSAVRFHP
jgi:MYXO-CTERM domain-containing protein